MWRSLRSRWLVGALMGGALLGQAGAEVPAWEESGEFRFGARPWETLRVTRRYLEGSLAPAEAWLQASSSEGGRETWVGDRLSVRWRDGAWPSWERLGALGLRPTRALGPGGKVWILQARDPWASAAAAAALASDPAVASVAPVQRRARALHGGFSPRPNDPFFGRQWHLENRAEDGTRLGPDLNPRAAWPVTRGEGVTIGFSDTGFETDHPDLRDNASGAPHYNFIGGTAGAAVFGDHGTLVAGLSGARGDNRTGVTGVAPRARLAGWILFDDRSGFTWTADDQGFADMFVYQNDAVVVQNHSWGSPDERLFGPSDPELATLDQALEVARGGRGVIMVRSGGNLREDGGNANDDGYANDPRVIGVAAVGQDGRPATYSNPGACLLVAAPSSDSEDPVNPTPGITTTDRVGSRGWNTDISTDDGGSYASDFDGTSAAAPQVAGIAALMVSVNTNLSARDAQQILAHASRPPQPGDPKIQTNGAGYRVSHDVGFGVPDAGLAVRLAQTWKPRAPLTRVSVRRTGTLAVPDDGLRLWVSGASEVEVGLRCVAGTGLHPDDPTTRLPLVDVGRADAELTRDLTGSVALVERGGSRFEEKAARAARAGAAFVVFYDSDATAAFIPVPAVDDAPFPVVMLSAADGRGLVQRLAGGETVRAQIRLNAASWTFAVTNPVVCEQVGLRVRASHRRRGDLRIVLRSPAGTRSVLQQVGNDIEAGPVDWTFWSTQHFYESALGTWTASFADEEAGTSGSIVEAELLVRGTAIEDSDADGLDDGWERRWFGGLQAGPRDDGDLDGASNAREQALDSDPRNREVPFQVALDPYDSAGRLRLSWPSREGADFRVRYSDALGQGEREVGSVAGLAYESDWVAPRPGDGSGFWRIEEFRKSADAP